MHISTMSRDSAAIRIQNPALGCANVGRAAVGVNVMVADGAVAAGAEAGLSPAPLAAMAGSGTVANALVVGPVALGAGDVGGFIASRRDRANIAVTAAPKPQRLVTPHVSTPITGTRYSSVIITVPINNAANGFCKTCAPV